MGERPWLSDSVTYVTCERLEKGEKMREMEKELRAEARSLRL
jgi:hypothetical protein